MLYREELVAACKAVKLAAELCTEIQLQLKESERTDKSDDSPVTVADYGAQALVAWSLQQTFSDIPFRMVAEENSADLRKPEGQGMARAITDAVNSVLPGASVTQEQVLDLIDQGGSDGGSQGRHWVLDPIDGTRGFVGMRQYAICLGLLDQGKAVLGALACPNLPQEPIQDEDGQAGAATRVGSRDVGCLFAAITGQGAFVGPLRGDSAGERTAHPDIVAQRALHARFMESFESRHSNQGFTAQLAKELGVTAPPLRLDSQAKYGALARGDAAILLRFPHKGYREKIWDHCAGAVIVEEAGARISDASGKCLPLGYLWVQLVLAVFCKPLDFGSSRWLDIDQGIVTATPRLHASIVSVIQKIGAP
eukprot:jgi/Astpho2/7631/Aster-02524